MLLDGSGVPRLGLWDGTRKGVYSNLTISFVFQQDS